MATYKVIEKIGEGGMGVVYRAQQTALGRDVALKLLLSGEAARPNDLARFSREVRSIARVNHPNVIRILDYGTIDGRPYYAMDYLGNALTLGQLLKKDGQLTLDRAIAVLRQLLDALAAVHRHGLIHRDVKPGNIMVDPDDHLTLMDFGLVKDLEASSMTRTGMMIGTPRYLAPEAVAAEPVDARSDLFAVGVMLHEGLSGKRLFQGDTLPVLAMQIVNQAAPPLRAERRDCPTWLADLIHRLLAKDPAQRPQTALEALNALRAGVGEPPQTMLPAPPAPPASTPSELPQSTILGGLDALRQDLVADASPTPTPVTRPVPHLPATASAPTSRPGTLRPRTAGPNASLPRPSSPPTAPPTSPPTSGNLRVILLASATFAGVFALIVALFLPRSAPLTHTASASPDPARSASDLAPPGAASPAATAAAAALREAIQLLAPAVRIAELRADLRPLTGFWFRNPPDPRMSAFRQRARPDLEARAAKVRLAVTLSAFIPLRGEFFSARAGSADDRLATYLAINDLMDLELFSDCFGIGFAPVVGRALHTSYGQSASGALMDEPAAGYALRDVVDNKVFRAPADPHAARWTITDVAAGMRFHCKDDAESSDWMKTVQGAAEQLTFDPAEPLLSLAGVQELELSGWAHDMDSNSAFEIQLSDGSGWRTAAILRGLAGAEPRRWFHTVDRALFTGPRLALRVHYRIIPDMNTGREFAYLNQVQVHHRP